MAQDPQPGAAKALLTARAKLMQAPESGGSPFHVEHAALVDRYFNSRLAEIWPKQSQPPHKQPLAVVAVGGYGRSELCPFSDIDILVVYEKKIPTEALDLAQSLLVPLWDLGYDLGHGFRSIKDCVRLAREDFQVMASLLDARLVAGNQRVFDTFEQKIDQAVIKRKKQAFIDYLDQAGGPRKDSAGDEGALLEPDLKNGRGALRDYHRILWLGRACFGAGTVEGLLGVGALTEAEAQAISDLSGFLLRVRTRLHLAAGRRNNRLHFEHQVRLARELGFEDRRDSPGVERFLASLNRAMAGLHALHRSFRARIAARERGGGIPPKRLAPGVVRLGDELAFDLPRDYPDDPMVLLHVFECAAQTGLPLAWAARGLVSAHLYMAKGLLQKPEALRAFTGILASGRAFATLEQMRETGLLGALIPEFARVQDLVQFDTYHLHPVGRHSLMAMGFLEELATNSDPHFGPLWRESSHKITLMWAALFHDMGKGLGGGHSQKGATLAQEFFASLEIDEKVAKDVAFLVREHLLLSEAAERRDLGDESQVASVAGIIGTPARLDMLYLLTYADAKATGPKAWNGWKAALVGELRGKVSRMLEQGALAGPQATQKALRARDVIRRMGKMLSMDPEHLERRLADMPARYALTMEPEAILGHFAMADRLDEALEEDRRRKPGHSAGQGILVLEAAPEPENGRYEITLAAKDKPGLFATFCGVLALHDINIDFAECFLWRDGTVIDRFVVSGLPEFLTPEDTWERVRYSARAALTGRLSLAFRLEEKRRSPLAGKSLDSEPRVTVDNESSDFYTLVEIEATDRIGLLYHIAETMAHMDISIHLAKIATYGHLVRDVFFVRDNLGRKIEDSDGVAAMKAALLPKLSGRDS